LTASRFRMIEESAQVVVPYGTEEQQRNIADWVTELRAGTPHGRYILRQLQPYMVAVRPHEFTEYEQEGFVVRIGEHLGEWHGSYDHRLGIQAQDIPLIA